MSATRALLYGAPSSPTSSLSLTLPESEAARAAELGGAVSPAVGAAEEPAACADDAAPSSRSLDAQLGQVLHESDIARIACRRKGRAHVRHGRDDLSSDTKLLQWSENSGASSIEVATHGEHSSLGISLAAHDAATSGRKFPRKFPESYTDSGSQISSRISGNLDQGQ